MLAVSFIGEFEDPEPTSKWKNFFVGLRNLGVPLWNDNRQKKPTHWLAIDFHRETFKRMKAVPIENRFLICAEPRAVNPLQYARYITSQFSRVITTSSDVTMHTSVTKAPGGSLNPSHRPHDFFPNDGHRQGYVMLNQNKFSLVSSSNYALRSRLAQQAGTLNTPIHIGGRDWARGYTWTTLQLLTHVFIAIQAFELPSMTKAVLPLRKSSRDLLLGFVPDELEVLSHFRINIVIENESSYTSEKLYKALRAGCQCVYVGPNLNPRDFPNGFLHQAQESVLSIFEAIERADAYNYSITASEMQEWFCHSEHAHRNSSDFQNSWILGRLMDWIQ